MSKAEGKKIGMKFSMPLNNYIESESLEIKDCLITKSSSYNTATITIPSTILPGDMIISILYAWGDQYSIYPDEYIELGAILSNNSHRNSVCYKIYQEGDSLTLPISNMQGSFGHFLLIIPKGMGIVGTSVYKGNTTNLSTPVMKAPFLGKNTLWIGHAGIMPYFMTISYPSNFTDNRVSQAWQSGYMTMATYISNEDTNQIGQFVGSSSNKSYAISGIIGVQLAPGLAQGITIIGEEYSYVNGPNNNGPIVNKTYSVLDANLDIADPSKLWLDTTPFNNAKNLNVIYNKNMGNLEGRGGSVESFDHAFVPQDLIELGTPMVHEYIKAASMGVVQLKKIDKVYIYNVSEVVSASSTGKVELKPIDLINP